MSKSPACHVSIKVLHWSMIDFQAWDNCIERSVQPRLNALSWYLQLTCPSWDGLVIGDYDAVLPFTYRGRYLKWLVNPAFSQQLGLFTYDELCEVQIQAVVNQLKRITLQSYSFNSANQSLVHLMTGVNSRPNYVLDLSAPYEQIRQGFHSNTRRNIQSAGKLSLEVRLISSVDIVNLKLQYPASGVSQSVYRVMPSLLSEIEKREMGFGMGVYCEGRLIAGVFVSHYCNRLTYLLSASTDEGKEKKAMFLLVDHLIRQYCGTETLLDFEGSVIPGVARFFLGFGAREEVYYSVFRGNVFSFQGLLLSIYQSCTRLKKFLSPN